MESPSGCRAVVVRSRRSLPGYEGHSGQPQSLFSSSWAWHSIGTPSSRGDSVTATVDIDAYFQRVHWSGGRDPTLETLAGLIEAHTANIPFENLDVLLGGTVRLDLDGLQSKIVAGRRGGYCFEHASLFAAVLEALGFQIARHAARVILFGPLAEAKRDHMFMT